MFPNITLLISGKPNCRLPTSPAMWHRGESNAQCMGSNLWRLRVTQSIVCFKTSSSSKKMISQVEEQVVLEAAFEGNRRLN